jgi:PEP-CTERM motif
MRTEIFSIALLVALVPAPSLAAVVVANSGGVTAGALARVDGGGLLASDSNSDSFSGKPRSLKAGLTVSSTNPLLQRVSSTTSVGANFLSADNGTVVVNLSREFTGAGTITGAQNNQGNGGQINFFYSFTPTVNAILNLTSNVSVQGGNPFGFQGFVLRTNDNAVLGQFNAINPTTSGSATVELNRGILYTLTIENASNIGGALPSIFNGSTLGEFSFSIAGAAVPEPATWAMMLAGFGFVGAASRRRKAAMRVSYN